MQTPPPLQKSANFHERCAQCWIDWKINFPIFIFWVIEVGDGGGESFLGKNFNLFSTQTYALGNDTETFVPDTFFCKLVVSADGIIWNDKTFQSEYFCATWFMYQFVLFQYYISNSCPQIEIYVYIYNIYLNIKKNA